MKNILFISILLLALTGCNRYPSEDEIPEELTIEADAILSEHGLITENELEYLSPSDLPESINQLKPKSVLLREEGLYIKLWSSFVEEGGLFIPRDKEKEYNRNTDPGYWKANGGTYYYIIKG